MSLIETNGAGGAGTPRGPAETYKEVEGLRHLGDLAPFGQHPVCLAQLPDDLLGGVASSLHLVGPPLAHDRGRVGLSYGADRSQGGRATGALPHTPLTRPSCSCPVKARLTPVSGHANLAELRIMA